MSIVQHVTTAPARRAIRIRGRRTWRILTVTSLAILPTALTSCQQVQDLATQWTDRKVPGPTLEGTYRFIYDTANSRANGAPATVQSDKVSWAFRSECRKSGCIATGTALDRDDASAPMSPALNTVLRYTGNHWEGLPTKVQVVAQGPCLGPGNTIIGQAEVTYAESWKLWPKKDGTLTGKLNATVLSNECGSQGWVLTVPLTATRAGDVSPKINVADPGVAAWELKSPHTGSRGPLFNGVYQFDYFFSARTRGGIPAPLPAWASPLSRVWTMRSECNTPTHCIAAGSPNISSQPGAVVLESAGDTWQTLSPQLQTVMCVGLPIGAAALVELSLNATDNEAIHGNEIQTMLSNECGDKGAVYKTPVAIRMLDDTPARDAEIADPALFLA